MLDRSEALKDLKDFRRMGAGSELWYLELKQRYGEALTPSEQARWEQHQRSEERKRRKRSLKLKAFRERVGLSQSALAKVLGISRRTVCYWEAGRHAPREPDCVRLIYIGFDYWRCKWSLNRSDSLRHIANVEGGYVTVKGVLVFYSWWLDDQDSGLDDYTWRWLSKRLDTGDGYAF